MTDPLIQNTVLDATGKPFATGHPVVISLIGGPAWRTDDPSVEISQLPVVIQTDSTGSWSLNLCPNSLLNVAGTYYTVVEPNGAEWIFIVPNVSGTIDLNTLIVGSTPTPNPSIGVVRYDISQILTPAQMLQLRENTGTEIFSQDTAPTNPVEGQIWVQTNDTTDVLNPTFTAQVGTTPPISPIESETLWVDTSGSSQPETASGVSVTPVGNISSTDVQSALAELDTEKVAVAELGVANGVATLGSDGKVPANQLASTSGGTPTAASTTFSPTGDITQTNVQAAIAQLDVLKMSGSLAGAANGVATLGPDGKVPANQLSISGGSGSGVVTVPGFVTRNVLEDFSAPEPTIQRVLSIFKRSDALDNNGRLQYNDTTKGLDVGLTEPNLPAGVTYYARQVVNGAMQPLGTNAGFSGGLRMVFPTLDLTKGTTFKFWARWSVAPTILGPAVGSTSTATAFFWPATGPADFANQVYGTTSFPENTWTEFEFTVSPSLVGVDNVLTIGVDTKAFSTTTAALSTTSQTYNQAAYTIDIALVRQGDIETYDTTVNGALGNLQEAVSNRVPFSAVPPARTVVTLGFGGGGPFIWGPGEYLIPASVAALQGTSGTALGIQLRYPSEPSDGALTSRHVDILYAPRNSQIYLAVPNSTFIPSQFTQSTADENYYGQTIVATLPAGYTGHIRLAWMGHGAGYKLESVDLIPPVLSLLPGTTNVYLSREIYSGTTYYTNLVNGWTSVPSVAKAWLTSIGAKIYASVGPDSLVQTDPTLPNFGNDIVTGKAGGYTDSTGMQSWASSQGGTIAPTGADLNPADYGLLEDHLTHTLIHETCHLIDFSFSLYLSTNPTGSWDNYDPHGPLSFHPDFQAIYNAAVADSSITHVGIYAFTAITEFWAETVSYYLQGITAGNDFRLLEQIIGTGRIAQFQAFMHKIGFP